MKKILYYILSITIELVEFGIMALVGIFIFNIGIIPIIRTFLVFIISRFIIGEPGHYKIERPFDLGWLRCFLYTSALCLSLFLTTRIDITVGILFTIFTVYIISGKGNINDMTMGRNERRPYETSAFNENVFDWASHNQLNPKMQECEDYFRDLGDELKLKLFLYRYRDLMKPYQIKKILDWESWKVARHLEPITQVVDSYRIRK